MSEFNVERLLVAWARLDMAVKRISYSTPDAIGDAVKLLEQMRWEMNEVVASVARDELESQRPK